MKLTVFSIIAAYTALVAAAPGINLDDIKREAVSVKTVLNVSTTTNISIVYAHRPTGLPVGPVPSVRLSSPNDRDRVVIPPMPTRTGRVPIPPLPTRRGPLSPPPPVIVTVVRGASTRPAPPIPTPNRGHFSIPPLPPAVLGHFTRPGGLPPIKPTPLTIPQIQPTRPAPIKPTPLTIPQIQPPRPSPIKSTPLVFPQPQPNRGSITLPVVGPKAPGGFTIPSFPKPSLGHISLPVVGRPVNKPDGALGHFPIPPMPTAAGKVSIPPLPVGIHAIMNSEEVV